MCLPRWALGLLLLLSAARAQPAATNAPPATNAPSASVPTLAEVVARLRDEGTNRSQVAEVFGYLTDVIGARLTGSPNCRRANEWTRDKLSNWGLTNAHLEAWGPFGRGWSVRRFSAQVIEPQGIPLVAWPKAWSHGRDWPIVGDAVYLDAKNEADLQTYKGKLKGAIVLVSAPREISLQFDPLATRQDDTNLLRLANAPPGARPAMRRRPPPPAETPSPGGPTNAPPRRQRREREAARTPPPTNAPPADNISTNAATNAPPRRPPRPFDAMARLRFAVREGAALTVSISGSNDGTALLVGEAQAVMPESGTNQGPAYVRASATNAPAGPPQIVLAAEQYNRVVHMLQAGEKVRLAVEVQTQFHDHDLMCYNTLAELPGTDRRKETVMLGAHLDSLASGTGATDNAAGVAVCLEAVRLIKAVGLKPRRTIRVGLWSGEEQGLLGSKAYVAQHLGYYTNRTQDAVVRSPKEASRLPAQPSRSSGRRTLVKRADYGRFSAYYNLDNGAGRIRGIYLQGNETLRPIFRPWLDALRELRADTITAANTDGTDHLSFDSIGLPGFQFIQDPVEYWRSYHTSIDVRERAPVADLQQAAIVMATFAYQTAMSDQRLPRKPLQE
jgi:hypothetical protein